MIDFLFTPFETYSFLRRALMACFALSLGCAPVGVFLVLRRMSLLGDALSHSVLPGVAIGYILAGLSLPYMGLGGMISGLIVAFLAGFVSQKTLLKEDASFVGFYLIALAIGAILVSTKGNNVDLIHILFGSLLAVTPSSLLLVAGISSSSLIVLALIYRPLIIDCFDPLFMRSIRQRGHWYHGLFMGLVVLNMVAAFQTLGTLMSLGMMMMPAIAARFWARSVSGLCVIAFGFALSASFIGLVLSYHYAWPSGPSVILTGGFFYLISLSFGPQGSFRRPHR